MRPLHFVRLGKFNWGNRACALLLFCATTAIASSAQTLTTLHSFDSTDGANPFAGLVQAIDGNFYGTTYGGGANANNGTVFKITPSGTLTTLYSLCAQGGSGCTDGALPSAGLVQVTNGNLYGTAAYGGANNRGTVFKITTSGKLKTLYSFCSAAGCADGALPYAALVQATNGNFYGTTDFGGTYSYGAVFQITTSGKVTTLYSFCATGGCPDGARPYAGLIQATDGAFYGTTQAGGANKNTSCAVEGCGTVFKITASGALTTLYNFCSKSGCTDGQSPAAGLVQATDGNFYGTTVSGGTLGAGTIFKIAPSGKLTTLHSFCSQTGCADGEEPDAGLIQGTNGNFYGTTFIGGTHGYGAVFGLSTGLGPFVETRPTSGKVGKAVTILGTNLTGATSVAFNGTAATFTVVSNTEITTKVPTGATTGTVQVTTPGGTLKSNVVFRVP